MKFPPEAAPGLRRVPLAEAVFPSGKLQLLVQRKESNPALRALRRAYFLVPLSGCCGAVADRVGGDGVSCSGCWDPFTFAGVELDSDMERVGLRIRTVGFLQPSLGRFTANLLPLLGVREDWEIILAANGLEQALYSSLQPIIDQDKETGR